MPTYKTDVIFNIYNSEKADSIASKSKWVTTPNPGTNKLIKGWQYGSREWSTSSELESIAYAPSIWDPSTSGILQSQWQSGYGDNNDLLLIDVEDKHINTETRWSPIINHGYFYTENKEWYLFSDSYQTEFFTAAGLNVSGFQEVQLKYDYKPTNPILVRRYSFDNITKKYNIDLDFRKVQEFSVFGGEFEWRLDASINPPKVILDGDYSEVVGAPVTTISGVNNLELLGFSDKAANQEFQSQYIPWDASQPVEVWTWANPTSAVQWTTITGYQDFTEDTNLREVKVDYERGTVTFGNYSSTTSGTGGAIPPAGHRIGVTYTKSVSIEYEPVNTTNYICGFHEDADINPVNASNQNGFVQIATQIVDPGAIVLSATNLVLEGNVYLIELGNNVGRLEAEVKSTSGQLLEGQEVTFEVIDPVVGSFGGSSIQSDSITGENGIAINFYNSPKTATGAGQATVDVVHDSGDTIITVEGLADPGDLKRLFAYKVHKSDEVLGIPEANLSTYYSDYLSEQNIVEDPDGTVSTEDFEKEYRAANLLNGPTTYPSDDISTGKKTILLTIKDASGNVIDPETGTRDNTNPPLDVFSPLYPSSIVNLGTDESPILQITYSGVLLDLPGTGDTKSYFLVGDSQTKIVAKTINKRTGKVIRSNEISLRVRIPETSSGSFITDDLNTLSSVYIDTLLSRPRSINSILDAEIALTSGNDTLYSQYLEERTYSPVSGLEPYTNWFRRTRRADTVTLNNVDEEFGTDMGLRLVELLESGEVPLGFRLKSPGVTAASLLDQITYIDPNSILPSGYFGL